MPMKFAFIGQNTLGGIEDDARFARENGFEALEFNYWGDFAHLTQETVEEMRRILDRHGVRCSMLGLWGWNHISPEDLERDEAHRMLDRAIEFGRLLGASVLTTGAGEIPDAPLDRKVAAFARYFPPFLKRIEKAGMKPALYAVHGTSFLDGIAAYERLWAKCPQVGMKFDPANWRHHGDDYLAALRAHGDKVAYVHIKEHLYIGSDLASEPAAGLGDIQWGKVMAFLYEHHYDGYLSVEPHGPVWSRGDMRRRMLLLSKRYISQFIL